MTQEFKGRKGLTLRDVIESVPGARPLTRLLGLGSAKAFPGSAAYWDRRYRDGGNSGAGSYKRLAKFKANFLNGLVSEKLIETVIEFGTGDGAQLSLASYPHYVGVDVSSTIVEVLRARFADDLSKEFFVAGQAKIPACQLALSLDVIYHLVEDGIYHDYMENLFAAALGYVVIYSSNEDKIWPDSHVRHRRFTDWVTTHASDWNCIQYVENPYSFDPQDQQNTSFADFYVFAKIE